MHAGSYIFRQLTSIFSRYEFEQCVDTYHGDHYVKTFPCWQQFLCLFFGQLTFRESVRSIVLCLNTHPQKLYHLGFTSRIRLSTLCDANEQRNWRIYEMFAQKLISRARILYVDDPSFLHGLDGKYYALDSTTIDLCLSVFPWARYRGDTGAMKVHTLLDLHGNIPTFVHMTAANVHDVNILDELTIETGACYIIDRGYIDYRRLHVIQEERAFFITRTKSYTRWCRLYSHPIDRSTGLRCDQTIRLVGPAADRYYSDRLRRVKFYDADKRSSYVFLTNNFTLTALQIAQLYKQRWQIELFFKWMKGHLNIKVFWGDSENAVRTQIWTAVCTYLAVAILKKELSLPQSMYEILQILSTTPFEKSGLNELFSKKEVHDSDETSLQMALGLGC